MRWSQKNISISVRVGFVLFMNLKLMILDQSLKPSRFATPTLKLTHCNLVAISPLFAKV